MEGLRPEWTVKAIVVIVVASILLRGVSESTNHTVGGGSGWDLSSNLQAWTSKTTFHVGDSLVFSYTPVHDVVEVDPAGYQSCDASSPIATHNDGETVVPLGQEGARYFICGHQGHCQMGLKMQVQVLTPEHHNESASEQSVGGRGSGNSQQPPPARPRVQVSGSGSPLALHHCTCGTEKTGQDCFFRLMALVTAMVIFLVDSWFPWELGFVYYIMIV